MSDNPFNSTFISKLTAYMSSSFFDVGSMPAATALRLPVTDLFTKVIIGFISLMAAGVELFRYLTEHRLSDILTQQPS